MGFGSLGEQGVESIHHYFNELERTYYGVRDPAQKLQLMLKEHTSDLHTAPSNVTARPEIKRRQRNQCMDSFHLQIEQYRSWVFS